MVLSARELSSTIQSRDLEATLKSAALGGNGDRIDWHSFTISSVCCADSSSTMKRYASGRSGLFRY